MMKSLPVAIAFAAAALSAAPAWSDTAASSLSGRGWTAATERAIDANLSPPTSVVRGEPLVVEVTFFVDADGRVSEAVVTRGAQVITFDDAVVEAVRRTARVSPPPAALVGRPITYRATFEPARLQALR